MNSSSILKKLIQFDTSNPPGNEKDCILWIKELLDNAGFRTFIYAKDVNRPNLIARLEGQKKNSPLMLYGHLDVVTTHGQNWQYPPFNAVTEKNCIWGRGALDMKGGVAMMLAALIKASKSPTKPPGDIIFAALSDEEAGGEFGAKYLVKKHPEVFKGVKHAIGEFGGFPIYFGGKCFYLIQIAEKQRCWMKAVLKGPGGHGAQRHTGGTVAKLGRVINTLDKKRLPVHITPTTKKMIETIADEVPQPKRFILKKLLNPLFTDFVINLLGVKGSMFDPLLHNTINITMISGGDKINVIPSEISFKMDGRILPGFTKEEMVNEVKSLVGENIEIEILDHESSPTKPDMALFGTLSEILSNAHPDSVTVPFLLPGITDARYFADLGIQTYGFLPMNLPEDFKFNNLIHAEDERIPEHSLEFGENAIFELIYRYKGVIL